MIGLWIIAALGWIVALLCNISWYADGELVYDMWSCSCCGTFFAEWDDKPDWKFCPNCGARMDLGE